MGFTKEILLDLAHLYKSGITKLEIQNKYPSVTDDIYAVLFPDKIVELLQNLKGNAVYIPYMRSRNAMLHK